MSVYVDDMEAPYRGMKMCHMIADSTEELLAMVDRIGVKRKWIQQPGGPREHFDICLAKKKLALEAGAIAITWHDLAQITWKRTKEWRSKKLPSVAERTEP